MTGVRSRVRTRRVRLTLSALLVAAVLGAGAPASASTSEVGTSYCGSTRWVSVRSDSNGYTIHDYGNGQQFAWSFGSRTVKYSSSGMHEGQWGATAAVLYTAGTYGLCL